MANNVPKKREDIEKFPDKMPWTGLTESKSVENCKLCQSPYRQEAEELYDRVENVKRVHKFLVDERHEDISYGSVRNHLKVHYAAHNDEYLVSEWASKIEAWLGCQKDQYASLIRMMAALEREVSILLAMNDGLTLHERRKNDDAIAKFSALLLNYRSRLHEIEKEQEPITLVFQQLQVILQDEMANVDTPEVKGVVKNVLTRLKEASSDIILSGDK